MNKKIYFNNKFIQLLTLDSQSSQDQEIKKYTYHDAENFKKIIDAFLKEPGGHSIKVMIEDFSVILDQLKKIFYYIEAAGGFIEKDGEFLFIHRHQRWDLPKGKLEKSETVGAAAIRECEEECGIRNLTITKPLNSTFHIYPYKKGFALKQTYWFYMLSDYKGKLTPQSAEDIDEVKWFRKNEIIASVKNDTYFTINDVIAEALTLNKKST